MGASRGAWTAERIRAAMALYAVTDSAWLGKRTLAECVEQAVSGGATFVQLREKGATTEEMAALAKTIAPVCRRAGVPFVINDDVEAAALVGADGVHVGQSDMACRQARAVLGEDAIIGVSVQTVEQALSAQEAGADYLGVGAMIATPTKPDAADVSYSCLKEICATVSIPVVAIGGLNSQTAPALQGSGIDGIAVVSALFAAPDIHEAARILRKVSEQL